MGVFDQFEFSPLHLPSSQIQFSAPAPRPATGLGPNLGGRVRLMYLQLIDSFQFDSEKPLTEFRDMSRARQWAYKKLLP